VIRDGYASDVHGRRVERLLNCFRKLSGELGRVEERLLRFACRIDAPKPGPGRRADAVPELVRLADERREDRCLLYVLADEFPVELGGERIVRAGDLLRFGVGG